MKRIEKIQSTILVCLILVSGIWFLTIKLGSHSTEPVLQDRIDLINYVKSNEPIQPIPLEIKLDANKVALGEILFHDVRLSVDDTLSCASCHNLSTAGTIRTPKTIGRNGELTKRNSPTVFNSDFNFVQYWDGRAESLEKQVDGPFENKIEFNLTWPEIVTKLNTINEYKKLFETIYPQGITPENIKDAIATFERSLITPNSRFDRYLRQEQDVLKENEIRGYEKFKNLGCISCHQGINIGGNLYQRLGIFTTEISELTEGDSVDLGRYEITGIEDDKYVFKVPSLRNVAVTQPYFHNGSVETLEKAISIMGMLQLGRVLSQEEIDDIAAFLKTLTGEYKGASL